MLNLQSSPLRLWLLPLRHAAAMQLHLTCCTHPRALQHPRPPNRLAVIRELQCRVKRTALTPMLTWWTYH